MYFLCFLSFLIGCDNSTELVTPPVDDTPPVAVDVELLNIEQRFATFQVSYPQERFNTSFTLHLINHSQKEIDENIITIDNLEPDTFYEFYIRTEFSEHPEFGFATTDTLTFKSLDYCEFNLTVFPELYGQRLKDSLSNCFTPTYVASYHNARDYMLTVVESDENGNLNTIYSDYSINLFGSTEPIQDALALGVNTEHLFPQSFGAGQQPAKSDLYNIFPAREDVNNYRSNKPFHEIENQFTDRWYFLDAFSENIPAENIDSYSEGNSEFWEPREEVKGDIARAIFYFYLIYDDVADSDFFTLMLPTLTEWNKLDIVSEEERNRMSKIKVLQQNENPFIIDSTISDRLW